MKHKKPSSRKVSAPKKVLPRARKKAAAKSKADSTRKPALPRSGTAKRAAKVKSAVKKKTVPPKVPKPLKKPAAVKVKQPARRKTAVAGSQKAASRQAKTTRAATKKPVPPTKPVAPRRVKAAVKESPVPQLPEPVSPAQPVAKPRATRKPRLARATPSLPAEPAVPPRQANEALAIPAESLPRTTVKKPVNLPAILLEGDEPQADFLRGPGRKFAVSATQSLPTRGAEPVPEITPDRLPERGESAKLVLIARDPNCLYAHWDLSDEQQRHYNSLSATGHLSIRVHLRSVGGPVAVIAEVHPDSRHWFLHVEQSGETYIAQLGYQWPEGAWVAISTSELASTPAAARSAEREDVFVRVPTDVPLSHLPLPLPPASQAAPASVESRLPATPVRQLTPAAELSDVAPSFFGQMRSTEPAATASQPAFSAPATGVGWTPAQEQALSEFINGSLARHEYIGSEGIEHVIRGREAGARPGGNAAQSSMEAVPGLPGALPTSPSPQGPPAPQGFWFNVNAELVIYGATEPDATVSIGGRVIKLRPDGSFSYRFALPDGGYELPAIAVSVSGHDRRSANLKFSRETAYAGEVGVHPQDAALKAPAPENLPA